MKAFLYPLLALPLITGCASQNVADKEAPVPVADRPAAAPVDVGVDWGWRLVGDQAVRPVQVFSMDEQTFIQMRDRRPVVLLVDGKVVPFFTSWPYMVIQGVPDRIDIVVDGYRAVAEHTSARNPVVSAPDTKGTRRVERVKVE